MKQLRQYIRQILKESRLLTESAKTAADMPEGTVIKITPILDDVYEINYALKDPTITAKNINHEYWSNEFYGKILIRHSGDADGYCGNSMRVVGSETADGWGPLLYDIAMEYATIHGDGLTSDRASVSTEALEVWEYYMYNRSDVTAYQLDDMQNTLTPDKFDNCRQDAAEEEADEDEDGLAWVDSSLSKRYTKEPTTINAMLASGQLVYMPKEHRY